MDSPLIMSNSCSGSSDNHSHTWTVGRTEEHGEEQHKVCSGRDIDSALSLFLLPCQAGLMPSGWIPEAAAITARGLLRRGEDSEAFRG
jgi:hypothetical protein